MIEPDRDAAIVREAIAAIRRGQRDAYADIVNLYQRRLFGLALMMTRDPASAEDVVQDGLEIRLRVSGTIDGRLHVAVVTFRANVVRVISLRRANLREERAYEEERESA